MKNDTYRNAVDHLEFSDDLYEKVTKAADASPRRHMLRKIVMIAAICILLISTVFAVEKELREGHFSLKELGTMEIDMSDAQEWTFKKIEDTEGVAMHYMLGLSSGLTWENGLICSREGICYRITDDYQLMEVDMESISGELSKNDRIYSLDFEYTMDGTRMLTPHAVVYSMKDGRILAMVWSEDHHCWPVYLDPETKVISDALPVHRANQFLGRISFAQPFRNGLLISTVVDENKIIDGCSAAYNMLYYVEEGTGEPEELPRPQWKNFMFYVENDTIYYKTRTSELYELNDKNEILPVTDWKTTDDLTKGLLTGRSADGSLMIQDFVFDRTYVVDGLNPQLQEFDETTGYNASRHSKDGSILITYAFDDYQAKTRRIAKIGLLDQDSGELKMLECHSDYKLKTFGWLDDDRYMVVYEQGIRSFICIYEFTE